MHKDASNIFNLYLEAVEEQPQMTIDKRGNKKWHLHGKLHRVGAPAIERADGTKYWYLHGKLHREGAPAIENADGSKAWWYLHDEAHREDGPAYEGAKGFKMWYLHNTHYAKPESWAAAVLKLHNKPHDAAAVDAFLRPILKKDAEAAL